jgi:hypothetical protein
MEENRRVNQIQVDRLRLEHLSKEAFIKIDELQRVNESSLAAVAYQHEPRQRGLVALSKDENVRVKQVWKDLVRQHPLIDDQEVLFKNLFAAEFVCRPNPF